MAAKKLSVGECDIVVAVVGNPNVGKSTLFNALTGKIVHVANWPGVTVSRSEGRVEYKGRRICFVDLPGIYGLSPSSPEGRVARNYLLSGEPDVVLVVADALAPERTLYLPLQLLELTGKLVIALNKIDTAHSLGIHLRCETLSKDLGVPIVPVSALRGVGFEELLEAIVRVHEQQEKRAKIEYGYLEEYIREAEKVLAETSKKLRMPLRWLSIQALSGDTEVIELLSKNEPQALEKIESIRKKIIERLGRDPGEAIVSERYRVIEELLSKHMVRKEVKPGLTRFDKLFLGSITGPLISVLILLLAFFTIFSLNTGFPLNVLLEELGHPHAAEVIEEFSISGLMGKGFSILGDAVAKTLESRGHPVLASLLADGVIAGVGAVLSFLPLIMMAYAVLGALEDIGIASRIALAFDSVLRKFGYTGKAVFPFMISMGCNVPGVMATRALEGRGERLVTALTAPLIPCQARLVVLMAFASAFFRSSFHMAVSVVSVYMVSFVLVLVLAPLFYRVLKVEKPPELAMEIPPMHRPSLKVVWWHTWDNSVHFVKKAGTIILVLSIVSWLLLNYGPGGVAEEPQDSYAFMLGKALAPIFKLYGLSGEASWKIAFAFENGFVAKEGVLEAIALLHSSESPIDALRSLHLTGAQAFALMLAMSLYVPCLATIAIIYSETRSAKIAILAVAYMMILAITVSLIAYKLLTII